MYIKTNWVDNTTPINSTNMNKIEQGIYNNSLVADAVNATVKPSESALAEPVEITEGQITDVLAVNDVLIKGSTLQDGEPTPDSPVDVNVVSGSNVISTCNENLFPLKLDIDGTRIYQRGCNVIIQKDEVVFAAIGDDMYFGNVIAAGTVYNKTVGVLLTIPSGATRIYFKLSNNLFDYNFITFYDESKTSLGFVKIVNSLEIPADAKYFNIRLGIAHPTVGTTYRTKVMVSTSDKEYIPHQGKELPLDLGSIELCKIRDYQDYFYKSGSKWYLHKETEKIILGNYNWTLSNNTSISNINTNRWVVSNSCERANNANNSIICNILPRSTAVNTWDNDTLAIAQSVSQIIIRMPVTYTTATDIKTALQNLNAYSIALRATPTDTEITDTTLISQLEAIYNAPLYEETNITQENNDLPIVLDITACKDNINGIKAWIRK